MGLGSEDMEEGKISVYSSVAGKILKSNKLKVACCSFNAKLKWNKYPKSFLHTDSQELFIFLTCTLLALSLNKLNSNIPHSSRYRRAVLTQPAE